VTSVRPPAAGVVVRLVALTIGLGLALGPVAPSEARAHIVVASKPLRLLVAEADLVLRARVRTVRGIAARSLDGPGRDRPVVVADVLEVLRGAYSGERIAFAQHGHGVAPFTPGREHLLFLIELARHPELDALAPSGPEEPGHVRWVSLQEHDDAHPLDGPGAGALLEATRAYCRAYGPSRGPSDGARDGARDGVRDGARASPAEDTDWLREATLRLLESGNDHLAASAVRDLAGAPGLPLVTAADRVRLEAVLDAPATDPGVRVALLAALERRRLMDGRARWLRWLGDDAPTSDLVVTIRAAAQDPRPEVRARLQALLASDRAEVAAAAAAALGRAGDEAAVEPLAAALDHPSSRVRHAAIRGLGRTRTDAAVAALEEAGAAHPDPTTRRLALAEARKRRDASE